MRAHKVVSRLQSPMPRDTGCGLHAPGLRTTTGDESFVDVALLMLRVGGLLPAYSLPSLIHPYLHRQCMRGKNHAVYLVKKYADHGLYLRVIYACMVFLCLPLRIAYMRACISVCMYVFVYACAYAQAGGAACGCSLLWSPRPLYVRMRAACLAVCERV